MKKLTILSLSALMLLGVLSSCGNKNENAAPEPPKAMNVIYFIGDGTALPQVYAGMLASKENLVFPKFPYKNAIPM